MTSEMFCLIGYHGYRPVAYSQHHRCRMVANEVYRVSPEKAELLNQRGTVQESTPSRKPKSSPSALARAQANKEREIAKKAKRTTKKLKASEVAASFAAREGDAPSANGATPSPSLGSQVAETQSKTGKSHSSECSSVTSFPRISTTLDFSYTLSGCRSPR